MAVANPPHAPTPGGRVGREVGGATRLPPPPADPPAIHRRSSLPRPAGRGRRVSVSRPPAAGTVRVTGASVPGKRRHGGPPGKHPHAKSAAATSPGPRGGRQIG